MTDPSLKAFETASLVRSVWATVGPKALRDAARAYAKGYRQSGVEGDNTQQGGIILLDAEGRIAFHHANRSLGDHAAPETLVAEARRLFD